MTCNVSKPMSDILMSLNFFMLRLSLFTRTLCISKTKCTIDMDINALQRILIPVDIELVRLTSKMTVLKNLVNYATKYAKRMIIADLSILNLRIVNRLSYTIKTTAKMTMSVYSLITV